MVWYNDCVDDELNCTTDILPLLSISWDTAFAGLDPYVLTPPLHIECSLDSFNVEISLPNIPYKLSAGVQVFFDPASYGVLEGNQVTLTIGKTDDITATPVNLTLFTAGGTATGSATLLLLVLVRSKNDTCLAYIGIIGWLDISLSLSPSSWCGL